MSLGPIPDSGSLRSKELSCVPACTVPDLRSQLWVGVRWCVHGVSLLLPHSCWNENMVITVSWKCLWNFPPLLKLPPSVYQTFVLSYVVLTSGSIILHAVITDTLINNQVAVLFFCLQRVCAIKPLHLTIKWESTLGTVFLNRTSPDLTYPSAYWFY